METTPNDDEVCRICKNTPDSEENKKLIHPCKCKNEERAVHDCCLKKFIKDKSPNLQHASCSKCGAKYNMNVSTKRKFEPKTAFKRNKKVTIMLIIYASVFLSIVLTIFICTIVWGATKHEVTVTNSDGSQTVEKHNNFNGFKGAFILFLALADLVILYFAVIFFKAACYKVDIISWEIKEYNVDDDFLIENPGVAKKPPIELKTKKIFNEEAAKLNENNQTPGIPSKKSNTSSDSTEKSINSNYFKPEPNSNQFHKNESPNLNAQDQGFHTMISHDSNLNTTQFSSNFQATENVNPVGGNNLQKNNSTYSTNMMNKNAPNNQSNYFSNGFNKPSSTNINIGNQLSLNTYQSNSNLNAYNTNSNNGYTKPYDEFKNNKLLNDTIAEDSHGEQDLDSSTINIINNNDRNESIKQNFESEANSSALSSFKSRLLSKKNLSKGVTNNNIISPAPAYSEFSTPEGQPKKPLMNNFQSNSGQVHIQFESTEAFLSIIQQTFFN